MAKLFCLVAPFFGPFPNQVAESEEYRYGEEGEENEFKQASPGTFTIESFGFEMQEYDYEKEEESENPYE